MGNTVQSDFLEICLMLSALNCFPLDVSYWKRKQISMSFQVFSCLCYICPDLNLIDTASRQSSGIKDKTIVNKFQARSSIVTSLISPEVFKYGTQFAFPGIFRSLNNKAEWSISQALTQAKSQSVGSLRQLCHCLTTKWKHETCLHLGPTQRLAGIQ